MFIQSIKVSNFRSLKDCEVKFNKLNIFVGKNDAGKSNLIRALHLFFDNSRGYPFDWDSDFCCFATKRQKKADEIKISLFVELPENFSGPSKLVWTKVWRREGLNSEVIKERGGGPLSSRSKAPFLLTNARFDYVPATKSDQFFSKLLVSIYEMLQRTAEKDLVQASADLSRVISGHTSTILSDLLETMELESKIAPPSDLKHIFSALDFRSTSSGQEFSLAQRGDGIKGRHIPIILDWLANQARTLAAKGRPQVVSVWGYEEPENNLEMSACSTVADFFLDKCATHQTFITTHSPIFYSLIEKDVDNRVAVYGVTKSNEPDDSFSQFKEITPETLAEVDESMGLMPLIAPHLKSIKEELQRIKEIQQHLPKAGKPVLFVEGTTDKTVLERVLELTSPSIDIHIEASPITEDVAGCANWVADRLIAWSYVQPANRRAAEPNEIRLSRLAVGLFDPDEAGNTASKKCTTDEKCKNSPFTKNEKLKPSETLIGLARKGFKIPFGLEELFGEDVWTHAENKGWLTPRENLLSLYNYNDPAKTFEQHLNDCELSHHEHRLVTKKVEADKKGNLAKYVKNLNEESLTQTSENFKTTLDAIRKIISRC